MARLPSLFQSKIARQHLTTIFKPRYFNVFSEYVLSQSLLKLDMSWLNPSREIFEFFNLVSRIERGLYLHRQEWWRKGFYVNFIPHISFSYVGLRSEAWNFDSQATYMKQTERSLSSAVEFLKRFLREYERYEDDDLVLCNFEYYDCWNNDRSFNDKFWMNHLKREILWKDGNIYPLDPSGQNLFGFLIVDLRNLKKTKKFMVCDVRFGLCYKIPKGSDNQSNDLYLQDSVQSWQFVIFYDYFVKNVTVDYTAFTFGIRMLQKKKSVTVSGYWNMYHNKKFYYDKEFLRNVTRKDWWTVISTAEEALANGQSTSREG